MMMIPAPFWSSPAGAPTTIPLNTDYVKLLLHFDEASGTTFNDSSQFARVLTGGSNQYISSAQSKFFGGSLLVDHDSPAPIVIASTADFTSAGSSTPWSFDYQIYTVSSPNVAAAPDIVQATGGPTINLQNRSSPQNTARPAYNIGGGQQFPASAHSNGEWHHIHFGHDPAGAVNQKFGVNIDGVNVLASNGTFWTGSIGLNLFGSTGGANGTANQEVYFAEFLFYVGAVLYPVMGGFTPPALPYSVA